MQKKILIILLLSLNVSLLALSENRKSDLTDEQRQKIAELEKKREQLKAKDDALLEKMRTEAEQNKDIYDSELKKSLLGRAVEMCFYGRVVDQSSQPVASVQVSGWIDVVDLLVPGGSKYKEFSVATDSSGQFCIKEKGLKIIFNKIDGDGYKPYIVGDTFDFTMMMHRNNETFNTKKDKPFIFQLYKYGTTDYLQNDDFGVYFKKSENKTYYPLLLDTWYDKYGLEMIKEDTSEPVADPDRCLEISCVFSEDGKEFDLIFNAITEGSGIIMEKEPLNEAPEDGYQKEIVFHNTMVNQSEEKTARGWVSDKFYFFVQGPNKKFYSRLDVEVKTIAVHNAEPEIKLSGKLFTNPQGRRYLEYDEKFNRKEISFRKSLNSYRRSLEQQAKEKKEVFDVKAFEKLVDEGKAPQAIEQFEAENKRQFEERQKQSAAEYEAKLKAAGRWSEDPKERERLRKLYEQEQEEKSKAIRSQQDEMIRKEMLRREEAKAAAEKAKAEKEAAEKAGAEK